jgi:hypothetical protein
MLVDGHRSTRNGTKCLTLRPMIIDALVSGGRHIAPNWTRSIKQELEDDYGSFVTIHDDATVERVDQRTGKIGCAVTYEADLKELASKVLDDGATARAQILIRQMAQDGRTMTRRLSYTVQETSGGSFMAWLDLTMDSPSPPRSESRHGRWQTWNGCPPRWTIQGGVCKPYRGS